MSFKRPPINSRSLRGAQLAKSVCSEAAERLDELHDAANQLRIFAKRG